jgi:predicted amidohydrolase YtcJ
MTSPARKETITLAPDLYSDQTPLNEVNEATYNRPVFVLHLNDRAIPNGTASRAVGYTKYTPEPPEAEIQRGRPDNPTELLIAKLNATILYSTLAKGPRLSREDQLRSIPQLFMREINRFDVASAIDAVGGFKNYPDDDAVVQELDKRHKPRPRGLLWASFICFGVAALFLVALIRELL